MIFKVVLKDVGRVLGVFFGEVNKMVKLIFVVWGKLVKLKVMIFDEIFFLEFKEVYDN